MLNRFHVYYNVSVKGQKERLPFERSKRAKRQRRSDLGIPKKRIIHGGTHEQGAAGAMHQ